MTDELRITYDTESRLFNVKGNFEEHEKAVALLTAAIVATLIKDDDSLANYIEYLKTAYRSYGTQEQNRTKGN